jgi:hypothetical protein
MPAASRHFTRFSELLHVPMRRARAEGRARAVCGRTAAGAAAKCGGPCIRSLARPAYYRNTARQTPSDRPMSFGDCPACSVSGEYGDVGSSRLPENREHLVGPTLVGPPLSAGASLHAWPWSEVVRAAQQLVHPGTLTRYLISSSGCRDEPAPAGKVPAVAA